MKDFIFINACDELYVHVSTFFSAMVVHGVVFEDLLVSSVFVVPIPKGENVNSTNSETVGLH